MGIYVCSCYDVYIYLFKRVFVLGHSFMFCGLLHGAGDLSQIAYIPAYIGAYLEWKLSSRLSRKQESAQLSISQIRPPVCMLDKCPVIINGMRNWAPMFRYVAPFKTINSNSPGKKIGWPLKVCSEHHRSNQEIRMSWLQIQGGLDFSGPSADKRT